MPGKTTYIFESLVCTHAIFVPFPVGVTWKYAMVWLTGDVIFSSVI